ncbi:ER membrane protein complex subunit 4 [Apus apus]|uniref:ER membrane protein complex subunit 4 n=1 Tax=Apus apus TaxID=8895 RepID=UPI0021F900E7|nr:ER membrane protein complex subunit 4 [Apus apus]
MAAAAAATAAVRGRRFKWSLELAAAPGARPRGAAEGRGPLGFAERQLGEGGVHESDKILMEKRCWDVALAPLKQIPMNLFIMYMAGNTISIFPAMMVCMMGWRPLQALMSLSATLKALESSSRRALQGLVFLVGNGLGLALALYKCQAMGLLPTRPSDWLAFVTPPTGVSRHWGPPALPPQMLGFPPAKVPSAGSPHFLSLLLAADGVHWGGADPVTQCTHQ